MTKHSKRRKPSDSDLRANPLIGGSKGVTMAHATPNDLEESQGRNTVEGDVENDVNRQGGIDKAAGRRRRRTASLRKRATWRRPVAESEPQRQCHDAQCRHDKERTRPVRAVEPTRAP